MRSQASRHELLIDPNAHPIPRHGATTYPTDRHSGVIVGPVVFGPYSAPTAPAQGASGKFLLWDGATPSRSSQRFSTRAVVGSIVAPASLQQLDAEPKQRKSKRRRRRGLKDSTCIRHKPHHKERPSKSVFQTFSPFDQRFPHYMSHEPRFLDGFQACSPFSEEFDRVTKWPSQRRSRRRKRNTKRIRLAKKYLIGNQLKPKNWDVRSYHEHLSKKKVDERRPCGWEAVCPFDAEFVGLTSKPGRYQPKTSTHVHAEGLIVCSPFDDRFREQCQLGWWQEDDPDEFVAYSPFDSRFPSRFSPFKGRGKRTRSTRSPRKVLSSPEPWSSPVTAAPRGTAFPRMTPLASNMTANPSFHMLPMYSVPVDFDPVFSTGVP